MTENTKDENLIKIVSSCYTNHDDILVSLNKKIVSFSRKPNSAIGKYGVLVQTKSDKHGGKTALYAVYKVLGKSLVKRSAFVTGEKANHVYDVYYLYKNNDGVPWTSFQKVSKISSSYKDDDNGRVHIQNNCGRVTSIKLITDSLLSIT